MYLLAIYAYLLNHFMFYLLMAVLTCYALIAHSLIVLTFKFRASDLMLTPEQMIPAGVANISHFF